MKSARTLMLRYVALLWNTADVEASIAAKHLARRIGRSSVDLQLTYNGNGCCVFCASARSRRSLISILPNEAGVVLGPIFRRKTDALDDAPARPASLENVELKNILATDGRFLVSACWGSYLAFLQDVRCDKKLVLRSPCNAPPCLHMQQDGVDIFTSSIADCNAMDLSRLSIDWRYVVAHVTFGTLQCRSTAIKGVSQIGLGEGRKFERGLCKEVLWWDPTTFVNGVVIEDPGLAARMLRAATISCVGSWSSLHDKIAVRLSGGVDSSIVLGCLRRTAFRDNVIGLHHFWNGPLADERIFARAAAGRAGCDLIELERSRQYSLEGMWRLVPGATPVPFAFPDDARVEIERAKAMGVDAIYCGTMGDALFHLGPAAPAAGEYLCRHGFDRRFIEVALDAAHIDNISVWAVFKQALRDCLRTPRGLYRSRLAVMHGNARARLLNVNALEIMHGSAEYLMHSWLHRDKRMPRGKFQQIQLLPFDLYWKDPFAMETDPVPIPPFLSEPIVELCLRIPTYLNVQNGIDRSVARQAFADYLPEEIRRRVTKGSPDSWIRDAINRNVLFMKEILFDGVLVKERILDREKLAQAMPGVAAASKASVGCLVEHLCTEMWLRRSQDAWGGTHKNSSL